MRGTKRVTCFVAGLEKEKEKDGIKNDADLRVNIYQLSYS